MAKLEDIQTDNARESDVMPCSTGARRVTPQYLHIMSSVNNDALGTLAGALLFYLVVRFLKKPSNFLGLLF